MEAIKLTPENQTSVEQLTPPPTPRKKQTNLKRKPNTVLGFSLDEPQKKIPKPQVLVKISTGPSVEVSLVSSDEENEEELKEIFETPIVNQECCERRQNINDFEVFINFSEALFQHTKPDYIGCLPLIALVIHLCHVPQFKTIQGLENFIHLMLKPKKWRPINQLTHFQIQVGSILCSKNLETGENVWLEWRKLQKVIYPTIPQNIQNWDVKHLLGIWEAHADTCQIFVSRRTARILFNSLTMFDNYPEHLLWSSCDLCPSTTLTSTSSTSALTQTVLVAVPGSVEVQSGDHEESQNIEDEFSQLTSQLQSGKTSIDISLQMATQSKILKSEVQMQDYIYDLKIYRKEDIKTLDKSQWYTKVHTKALGTLNAQRS